MGVIRRQRESALNVVSGKREREPAILVTPGNRERGRERKLTLFIITYGPISMYMHFVSKAYRFEPQDGCFILVL